MSDPLDDSPNPPLAAGTVVPWGSYVTATIGGVVDDPDLGVRTYHLALSSGAVVEAAWFMVERRGPGRRR